MTVPDQPPHDPVSLNKGDAPAGGDPQAPPDFDPYRFGKPDYPIPPEYAPPGYVPPPQHQVPQQPQFPPYPPAPPVGGPPRFPSSPYGYPPPPPVAPRAGHGKAVAALVLGIASIVLCWLTIFDAIPIIIAIVLGAVALRESRFKPNREGRSLAIAGIVCALVGALLAVALTVLIYTRFKDCLDLSPGSSQYNSCIKDKL